jgi:hypothetical protein
MHHKTLILLSSVSLMNILVSFSVLRMDLFVHGDLYAYGLIYSVDWAIPYAYLTSMLWIFLAGALTSGVAAIVPHYFYSRRINRFSVWGGIVLPILSLVFEGLGIFCLAQKNSIVWNTLGNYGVQFNNSWAAAYSLMSVSTLVLMAVSLVVLVIPAIRAAGYEVQIERV